MLNVGSYLATEAGTYPQHSPTPALEADPTPEPLSSTAMQFSGSLPSELAALRYTDGLGLNSGGVKSLSPLCT